MGELITDGRHEAVRRSSFRRLRRGRSARSRDAAGPARAALKAATATMLLGGLAACAGEAPQVPATQEAAQYRAHARNYYQPPGPPWDPWGPYIVEASQRFDVPQSWIRGVMHQESDGQEFAVSTPGAMGLMQVMPFTFDLMREQYNLGDDPYDPHNNVLAGVAYIRQMYDIYGSPGFLAAYNAGPGRLDDYLTRNRPLPAETRHYVAMIGPEIAFEAPHNRSAADLMAMNHVHDGDAIGAVPSGPPVDPALTHSVELAWSRRSRGEEEHETEVAEATPVAAPVAAPIRLASASTDVRNAWARRETSSPPPTMPAVMSTAFRGSIPLADTRLASAPSPELANSVAEAPDGAVSTAHGRRLRFRLLNQAYADTLPPRDDAADAGRLDGGHWAIQVGAFGSAGAAHAATGSAVRDAGRLLGHARAEIAPMRDRHGHLYRARLTGLTRDAAEQACARIGRRSCIVVSPDGA